MSSTSIKKPPEERAALAERIYDHLHGPIAALGLIFIAVVVSEAVVDDDSPFHLPLVVVGWVLWGVFVLEFAVRLSIAPSTGAFLRKNWWQLFFLLIPFLNFLRVVAVLRVARAGRLVAAGIRASRSAGRTLTSRIGWMGVVTVVVVLLSANVLYEFGELDSYGDALHRAALAAVGGEPIRSDTVVAKVLDVVLAVYAVVVFAALAGALGAFFLEKRREV